jgi:hypothetical protein
MLTDEAVKGPNEEKRNIETVLQMKIEFPSKI